MSHQSATTRQAVSPWASGPITFAGAMLVITGVLQIFIAIPALLYDKLYVGTAQYVFAFDLAAWGWIQLITAIAAVGAGYGALRGLAWARIVGIAVAGIGMVAEFAFIPHFPLWSVLVIAIDVVIIWALATYRAYERTTGAIGLRSPRSGCGQRTYVGRDRPGAGPRLAPDRVSRSARRRRRTARRTG